MDGLTDRQTDGRLLLQYRANGRNAHRRRDVVHSAYLLFFSCRCSPLPRDGNGVLMAAYTLQYEVYEKCR